MRGIKMIDGEMVIHNKQGDHIISCPACKERGYKFDGQWMCPNDDCRVRRFFTC